MGRRARVHRSIRASNPAMDYTVCWDSSESSRELPWSFLKLPTLVPTSPCSLLTPDLANTVIKVTKVISQITQGFRRPPSPVPVEFLSAGIQGTGLPNLLCDCPRKNKRKRRLSSHHVHVRAASRGTEDVGSPVRHHAVQGFHQDVGHVVCQHLWADEDLAEL